MKKNIMIINLGSHFGGTEKYILNIIENIDLDKFNVHICGKKGTKFMDVIREYKIKGLFIFDVNFSKKSIIKTIKEVKRYIKTHSIDIIHSNGISADLISNLARRGTTGVKIVSTVHGFSSFDRMDRSKIEIKAFDMLETLLFKYNDYYIAVSNALKEYLVDRGLSENKIDVIYHAVNNLNNESYRERTSDEIIVGSVGRLEKVKGYDILINAVKVLKDKGFKFKCILVGDGSEIDNLKMLSEKLNVKDYIEFLGYQEDIYNFIDKMDIYVQPSRQESFGISIIEAMNKVKPVIASNVGGVIEIIENEKNGLIFDALNDCELAYKIGSLINDSEKSKMIAIEGKDTVSNKFSMPIFIGNLQNIYEKI